MYGLQPVNTALSICVSIAVSLPLWHWARMSSLISVLKDGRHLSYAFYGAVNLAQYDVFYFHGANGCRLDAGYLHKAALDLGIRLISVDRAGIGQSCPHPAAFPPSDLLRGWTSDIMELADHLQLEQFSILGMSTGGSFALACARFLPPSRLRAVGAVAPVAPIQEIGWKGLALGLKFQNYLVSYLPEWILEKALEARLGLAARDPDKSVLLKILVGGEEQLANFSKEEKLELEQRRASIAEAYRNGSGGVAREFKALVDDWSFALGDILDGGRVHLWAGDEDTIMPPGLVKRMADKIPGSRFQAYEGQTHDSLISERGGDMLRELVQGA